MNICLCSENDHIKNYSFERSDRMIYLSEYNVEAYRGVSGLELHELGDVNIITGGNNSGKSSVLESLMLLKNTDDISNVLAVSDIRNSNYMLENRITKFNSFIYLFNAAEPEKRIAVNGILKNKPVSFELKGGFRRVNVPYRPNMDEMTEFRGNITSRYGDEKNNSPVRLNELINIRNTIKKPENISIRYISPSQHISGRVFDKTVNEPYYKEAVIKALGVFDKNIVDIIYRKDENNSHLTEYVHNRISGLMPVSCMGDGVKKLLSAANGIVSSKQGILLIDDIDTSLQSEYFDDIFCFVVRLCMKFKIQLFASVRSKEALKSFLNSQAYDKNADSDDPIRVIRLEKKDGKTTADVIKGSIAYSM